MPIIEIAVTDRLSRHLAAVRLMSHMVFPDDAKLRAAAEITFRTILADWYSTTFASRDKREQARFIRRIGPKPGEDLQRALAEPARWVRSRIFSSFLGPAGEIHDAALLLTNSPSIEELQREWTRRWWPIVYTGKMVCLIGSIDQHHPEVGGSINKAIHILCRTEGNHKKLPAGSRRGGFPGVYESSLKKAWGKFKPVAHLCAAYVTTETHFYEEQIGRDFWEYWAQSPAFYDDRAFLVFCRVAKSVERFVTSFFPRAQQQPLIPKEEIFALPDHVFDPEELLPGFRSLIDEEVQALKTYQAPKQFV